MSISKYTKVALGVVAAIALSLCCFGCAGAAYNLDKDAALETDWGATVQYKVDSTWNEQSLPGFVEYKGEDDSLIMTITDVNSSFYKFSKKSTYADWLKHEEIYLVTPTDNWTYSNGTVEEVGTMEIDGVEFRVYKETYTVTYTEKMMNQFKEQGSEEAQVHEEVYFKAVVKDGAHDMEIAASSEELLNAVAATMIINWG